jgi:hypothetical protein
MTTHELVTEIRAKFAASNERAKRMFRRNKQFADLTQHIEKLNDDQLIDYCLSSHLEDKASLISLDRAKLLAVQSIDLPAWFAALTLAAESEDAETDAALNAAITEHYAR